jgi:hypothetical protein
MKIIRIPDALHTLRPNAEYNLIGHEYAGLDWMDAEQTKPTESEINAEVLRLQADYDSKSYQRARAAEYPDFKLYLDGVVKGDQEQIQTYIDACLAVKAKYPKETV